MGRQRRDPCCLHLATLSHQWSTRDYMIPFWFCARESPVLEFSNSKMLCTFLSLLFLGHFSLFYGDEESLRTQDEALILTIQLLQSGRIGYNAVSKITAFVITQRWS
jgi:hypothetical protein